MIMAQRVRFVRHTASGKANCNWMCVSGKQRLVALQDIAAGETITIGVDDCVCFVDLTVEAHLLERICDMSWSPRKCDMSWSPRRSACYGICALTLVAIVMIAGYTAKPALVATRTQEGLPITSPHTPRANFPYFPFAVADDALAEFEASKVETTQQIARFTEYVVQRGGVLPKEYSSTDCSFVEPVVSRFSTFTNFIAGGNVTGFVSSAQPTNSSLAEVPRRAADSVVWTFSRYLPQVVNRPPISFADRFIGLNISRPFGSWGVSFFNVSDIAQQGVGWYPQVEDPAPPLYALVTRNAFVANGHVLTCDGHVVHPGGCQSNTHAVDDGRVVTNTQQYDIVVPFCAGLCFTNYYHFVHEHLPRITLVHGILTAASPLSIRLVLPTEPTRYMRYYLIDVLGIPADRIIWDKVIGRQVVFPMSQRCGNTAMGLVSLMRDMVFSRVAATGNTTDPRLLLVFAERADASRMPRNYNELKAKLLVDYADRLRFETVRKESIPTQISAFRRADIVLGPHGANLANMIWMRKGAHLIEIMSHVGSYPNHLDGNMCYYNAASRVGVHHHLLLHPTVKRNVFTLSYDEFRAHIDHALDELRSPSHG